MDYDLLNACVALAQELAHSEACAFWSPLGPREAVDLSQEFFSPCSITLKCVSCRRTQNCTLWRKTVIDCEKT